MHGVRENKTTGIYISCFSHDTSITLLIQQYLRILPDVPELGWNWPDAACVRQITAWFWREMNDILLTLLISGLFSIHYALLTKYR